MTESSKEKERAVRVVIEGRVQGVGYRAWTERTAISLGLRGWVRNRRDGAVEAVFAGGAAAVDEMVRRCHQGPRSASVRSVRVTDESEIAFPRFEALPTA
jgi:acylphosphatase